MPGLLADHNLEGHFRILVRLLEEQPRRGLWTDLGWAAKTFADLGVSPKATDAIVWELCQQAELVLITGNRNDDGPDSLEATIQARNTPTSLPVFTLANLDHFMASREYAERVVDKLLDYAFDIDNYRGTGRLYLP